MKKLIISLAIPLILIVFILVWQWNNLSAIYMLLNSSQDKLSYEMSQSKQNFESAVNNNSDIVIRDFTEEEEKKIIDGKLSVDEAVKIIMPEYKNSEQQPQKEPAADSGKKETSDTAKQEQEIKKNKTEIVSEAMNEIFNIKAVFLAKLGELERAAKADVLALPSEQRTKTKLTAIGFDYVLKGYEEENNCNTQFNAVLKKLESQLKGIGESTEIVSRLREEFENEKKIKKAYYMNLLSEKVKRF